MKPVAGDANRQILEINATVVAALEESRTASLEQAMALNDLKAWLASAAATRRYRDGGGDRHPPAAQADTHNGIGDPDTIVCREKPAEKRDP